MNNTIHTEYEVIEKFDTEFEAWETKEDWDMVCELTAQDVYHQVSSGSRKEGREILLEKTENENDALATFDRERPFTNVCEKDEWHYVQARVIALEKVTYAKNGDELTEINRENLDWKAQPIYWQAKLYRLYLCEDEHNTKELIAESKSLEGIVGDLENAHDCGYLSEMDGDGYYKIVCNQETDIPQNIHPESLYDSDAEGYNVMIAVNNMIWQKRNEKLGVKTM